MNKEMNTNLRKDLGYETPIANVVTISIEGVLCASDTFEIIDWTENPDAL